MNHFPATDPSIRATTDFLGITIPYSESGGLLEELLEVLEPIRLAGADLEAGRYPLRGEGSALLKRMGPVFYASLTGGALAELRQRQSFMAWLEVFTLHPNRVTRLDAYWDVREPGPLILRQLWRQWRRNGVQFGRRIYQPRRITAMDAEGQETGTIYFGEPGARLQVCIYDKRHEQRVKGREDPGPWVRYELRFKRVPGVTLRDAWDPTSLFWHYAGGDILPVPACGCRPWVPGESGFVVPRKERTALERLQAIVDVLPWRDLAGRAEDVGDYGRNVLATMLEQRAMNSRSWGEGGSPPSDAP